MSFILSSLFYFFVFVVAYHCIPILSNSGLGLIVILIVPGLISFLGTLAIYSLLGTVAVY